MRKTFRRSFDVLPDVFAFVDGFFEQESIDRSLLFAINFATEELFTNMVKYNPGGRGDIGIELSSKDSVITVQITDQADRPFDVTAAPDVDVGRPLAERQPGGLGLHLIRKMVDRIEYDHRDGQSRVTFEKRYGVEDV
jgi:serine/threonine-protein kinase RsbW